MDKKILLIVGSLRKKSFNREVARYVESKLNEKGLKVSFLNYANIPFMNQDIEFPTPEEIKEVREKVNVANALWVFSPEYNGSVPGVLKNLLDWISRPLDPASFGAPSILLDKLVTVSSIAGGSKGSFVIPELKELLGRMKLNVLDEFTGLQVPGEAWQTGVLVLSDEQKAELDKQVEAFVSKL